MTLLPISSPAITAPASRSQAELGTPNLSTGDFLRLMTEQLKQQDPFAPTDNTQMVAQMAQMSASSGIAEMNASLKAIATQIADQTVLLQSLSAPPAPVPTAP